jgi:hypothetical protein
MVVADNEEAITSMLATYNASIPGESSVGPDGVLDSGGGACSLPLGGGMARSTPGALLLGLWGLLGLAWLRRQRG